MSSTESERYKLVSKWIVYHIRNQTEVFTNDSVETYGKLLCHIASADGVFSPEEREWIVGYRAASGAPDKVLDTLKTYEPADHDWKAELEKHRMFIELVKYNLIYDSFQAAAADDELHEEERKAISKLGQEIGVDEKTIEQIAQLHQDEIKIKNRRIALLFPKGVDETLQKAGSVEKP